MSRRLSLCLVALAVLVIAPAAHAGGPGLVSADGDTYYSVRDDGNHTVLSAMRDGQTKVNRVPGSWHIPRLTQNGDVGGLSPDGRTLVLSTASVTSPSRFLVVDARTLAVTKRVVLNGSFAFDALSPNGSRLYLIQHTSVMDLRHYVVRSYDLRANRLLAGRIADKTQRNWVMSGYAMTRETSSGGRWVYTLYKNPGGYPFIHALDTVRGIAHCIGLPWTGDQTPLANIVLTLGDGGRSLAVHWRSGRPWLAVDTANWHISYAPAAPAEQRGFPWRWLLIGLPGAVLAASALVLVARRWRPRDTRGQASPAPSAS